MTVVATDDEGLTGEQDVTVIVTNIDEAGEVTLSSMQPQAGVGLTATLSDPDGGETDMEWQWSSGQTSGGTFANIEGATSATYTPVEDDPATEDVDESDEGKFLRVTVTYKDGASASDAAAMPTPVDDVDTEGDESEGERTLMETSVHAVREAPEMNSRPEFAATMTRTVKEGTDPGKNVGERIRAMDDDNDVLTYSWSGGADMDKFDIASGTGQITVGAGTTLDYEEGKRTYEVVVKAEDPFGESATVMVTIMVEDVDEPPVFEAEDPEDYVENGKGPVETFTASDPEGLGIDWDLTGINSAAFSIEDGVLRFKESPDYENPTDAAHPEGDDATTDPANDANDNEYVITVSATEMRPTGDESTAQSTPLRIVVTVTNENERGTVTLSRLQPQVGAGGLTASLSDPDGGATDDLPITDAETNLTSDATWQWYVPKVSRPELEDDDHWQNAAGSPNNAAGYTPDADDEGNYLRVKASYTDGQGASKTAYAMSAYKVRATPAGNDAPVFPADQNGDYARELPESTAVDANVGAPVTATDANSDTLTYVLSGTHESSFDIDPASGQITVASALDFEDGGNGSGVYTVTVTAYDPSNEMDEQDVTITTTDVNEKPAVAGAAEVRDHDEKNSVDDTVIYTVLMDTVNNTPVYYTPSDVDAGDTTATLKLSLSGDDADAFELGEADANNDHRRALTFKTPPNSEAPTDANRNNVYKVTVVATDDEGLTGEQDVTVIVTNIDEAGEVTLSSMQPQAGIGLTATLSDPDGGETNMEWQWSSGQTSGGTFAKIEGATSATYTPVERDDDADPAIEGDEGKFLQVTVTYRDEQSVDDDDTTDNVVEGERTLTETSVHAVREAPEMNSRPEFAATMTRTVKEGTDPGKNVGERIRAMDDDNDVLTYSWSGGADMDKFDIASGTGQITVGAGTTLDYEEGKRTYEVVVKAEDPFGESATVMVTIMVEDVDEPPVFEAEPQPLSIQGARSVSHNENTMDVVESYEAMGTEADQVVWSLSGDDADDFRINNVGELTFATTPDYEDPADADMDNMYEVTVVATAGTATEEAAVTVTVADVDDEGTGDDLVDRYDMDNSGTIDKDEVLTAIDDYLFGTGADAISKDDVLRLIDLYLFS